MTKKVCDVIVEVLESAGVKHCYGIVGDTSNQIANSMSTSKVEFVHMRHEEVGAFAASAESLYSGNLTACMGSVGPGSLHFINGLYEAHRNKAPVVLIATQVVRSDMGFDAVQEIDYTKVFEDCSIYCETIMVAGHARKKMVAACQAALVEKGVAVIIVPADVAVAKAEKELPYSVHVPNPQIMPSALELEKMATILNKAKNVTIYAGQGCEHAHDEVVALAKKLKAPVAHTSRGKDFLSYDNPYNVGMTGLLGQPGGYHAVLDCDALLLLGTDFAWSQFYPNKAKIIQVDIDPTHLGRRHPVHLGVMGQVLPTVQALIPKIEEKSDESFLNKYVEMHKKTIEHDDSEKPDERPGRLTGSYLSKQIDKVIADDALIAADDGTASVWLLRHVHSNGKRRTFLSLLHGTMAGGTPTGIGLQKAAPDRQVVVMASDGGLSMLMGDLLTVVQQKLPLKIIMFDNERLGFVDIEQRAAGMVPVYTHLQNPNFGEIAKTMGMWGGFVEKASELDPSLKEWISQKGPALLQVKVSAMQLVVPPSPFVNLPAVFGMGVYSAKAILEGKGEDVWEMVTELSGSSE